MEVIVRCECGLEYSFVASDEKRVEICRQCGGILRVPAAEEESDAAAGEPESRLAETRTAGKRAGVSRQSPERPSTPAPPPHKTTPQSAGNQLASVAPTDRTRRCPNCGSDVPADVVVCDECAFNLETLGFVGARKEKAKKTETPAAPLWLIDIGAAAAVGAGVYAAGPSLGVARSISRAAGLALAAVALSRSFRKGVIIHPVIGATGGVLIFMLLYGKTGHPTVRIMHLHLIFRPLLYALSVSFAGLWSSQLAGQEGYRAAAAAGTLWTLAATVYLSKSHHLREILSADAHRIAGGIALAFFGAWLWETVLRGR